MLKYLFILFIPVILYSQVTTIPSTGGGSGTTTIYGLTDFKLTKTSNTVSTLGSSCSASAPCSYRIGGKVFDLTSPAVATLSGSSDTGTIFWYIKPSDSRIKAGHNTSATLTCDADCDVVTSISDFPAGTIPLQAHTFTDNVLDSVTVSMDHRAVVSTFSILAGTGISLATSGTTGEVTVSTDASTPFNDTVLHLVHEFENNYNGVSYYTGEGWFYAGITLTATSTTLDHPGTLEGNTVNTANSIAYAYLKKSYDPPYGLFQSLDSTINWEMQWIFKTPTNQTGGIAIRVGLIDSDPNTQTPGKGYWVRYNNNSACTTTGSDATWIYEAKDAASTTGTGPSYAENQWFTLSIRSTISGSIIYRMRTNGGAWSSDVTISEAANTPDEQLTPFMHVINCAEVVRKYILDKWEVYATGLSR